MTLIFFEIVIFVPVFNFAEIVAVPALFPMILPFESTDATDGLLLFHDVKDDVLITVGYTPYSFIILP